MSEPGDAIKSIKFRTEILSGGKFNDQEIKKEKVRKVTRNYFQDFLVETRCLKMHARCLTSIRHLIASRFTEQVIGLLKEDRRRVFLYFEEFRASHYKSA